MARDGVSVVALLVGFAALVLLVSRVGFDEAFNSLLSLVVIFGIFIPVWRNLIG